MAPETSTTDQSLKDSSSYQSPYQFDFLRPITLAPAAIAPKRIGAIKQVIQGDPDVASINTSFVEGQNLTMRISTRQFTRLTNAFSKKFENHCHALALYFVFYNFCRAHKTLGATPGNGCWPSPETVMNMTDLVDLIDATAAETPMVRGILQEKDY